MKELCNCGKEAIWVYGPGSNEHNPFYCDDCISSKDDIGCTCNWHYFNVDSYHPPLPQPEIPEGEEGIDWRWVEHPGDEWMKKITKDDKIWIYLDEKGRPHPCCEYFYDKNGFEND
jgi:hypothetical protein